MTCGKSQEFLAERQASIAEQVDARKHKLGPEEALALARQASQLWVAKGKKVVHLDLKQDVPSDAELLALLIGPSGNLRAPVLRRGKKLFVGFHREGFEAELTG